MTPPLLELREIRFNYPQRPVLFTGLNLHLAPGERLCIDGPNGAGKSTLLLLALGLLPRMEGEIYLDGRVCQSEGQWRELRQRVGIVFQDSDDQLFCPSVLEDVAFGPLNLGKAGDEAKRLAREALGQVGLEGFEERLTSQLSGGEKRLVCLATVLAMEPQALLLDEPANGLDEPHRDRVLALLQAMPQALIVVSHDRGFAEALCSRRLELADGCLREASWA